jgi:hypothetical protein
MKRPVKNPGWRKVHLDERILELELSADYTDYADFDFEVGMMLRGKINASAKRDRVISPDAASP